MDELNSSILTIPGIGYDMGAMILAEIGNISKFDSPDKVLAYAGLSPITYQSRYFNSSHSRMEKEAQNIYAMHYSMKQNMSAFGIRTLKSIWPKSAPMANIILLHYLMLQRKWFS